MAHPLMAACCAFAGLLAGCHNHFEKPLDYFGDAALDHYEDEATKVVYPNLECGVSDEVRYSGGPRTLRNPGATSVKDISLAEVIHLALANNQIIRTTDEFGSRFSSLLNSPDTKASVYDSALQETGFLFGRRGIEAALADFDANWTTSMIWGRDDTILNTPLFGLPPGATQKDETAAFATQIQKVLAEGSLFTLSHSWDYSLNNLPSRLFGSEYRGVTQMEYRRPLLAGGGAEYTRIAGPIGRSLRNVSTVGEGVVIARINNDITQADFERAVTILLQDVENLYWDLFLAYRAYHAEVIARDGALKTWREAKAEFDEGLEQGTAYNEAQAKDSYFDARARVENALAEIYATEIRLRRLLGLPVNDGTILRPKDEPTTAKFVPDWHLALTEALTRRVELRKQKWNIKSLQLQLQAARSLTRPRLDAVGRYRINAFGDTLWRDDDNDGITSRGFASGYGTLFQGDETGWNLGFEMSLPFGFRQAHAQVRNYELRITKAMAALDAMELDIAHELSNAFLSLDRSYTTAQTYFNRRRAAEKRVNSTEAAYKMGLIGVDLLLRAQLSLAAADIAYFQSVVNYNKALVDVQYRKGTLLDMNNVLLQEGLWNAEAYDQALRRAWKRSHAFDSKSLHAEPSEFVLDCPTGLCTPLEGYQFDGDGESLPQPDAMGMPYDERSVPPQPAPPYEEPYDALPPDVDETPQGGLQPIGFEQPAASNVTPAGNLSEVHDASWSVNSDDGTYDPVPMRTRPIPLDDGAVSP